MLKNVFFLFATTLILFKCVSSSEKEMNEDSRIIGPINLTATNADGDFLRIIQDSVEFDYIKIWNKTYFDHYFGKIKRNTEEITFIPQKGICIDLCKSGKWSENYLGIEFGGDLNMFVEHIENGVFYAKQKEFGIDTAFQIIQTSQYHELKECKGLSVNIVPKNLNLFELDTFDLNCRTTMICINSSLSFDSLKIEFIDDKIILYNYYPEPVYFDTIR